MQNITTVKNLRDNMQKYADKVKKGQSFIVFKRSQPLFRIAPVDTGIWEEVIDFTSIVKGGIDIDELLKRL